MFPKLRVEKIENQNINRRQEFRSNLCAVLTTAVSNER